MGGKRFEKATENLLSFVRQAMEQWHSNLVQRGVVVETLLVYAPTDRDGIVSGPAIKVRGVEAAACVRVSKLEERLAGRGDAIIWIDGDRWKHWSTETLMAVLDHELTHLQTYDDPRTSEPEIDDLGRPKIRIRKHDFDFGWFAEVAERHGFASFEVAQFLYVAKGEQMFFPGFEFVEQKARKKRA